MALRKAVWLIGSLLLLSTFSVTLFQNTAVSSGEPQLCVPSFSNPVLNVSGSYIATYPNTGSWFLYSTVYASPSVLHVGSAYRLWFEGVVANVSGIFLATSTDGADWHVSSAPVLTAGPNGSWDYSGPYAPSVAWNGSLFFMYYWGDNGTGIPAGRSIGLATSGDGMHWTKYAHNPILVPGPSTYDHLYVKDPNVIFQNGAFTMWYKGRSALNAPFMVGIERATSSDGYHWTKDSHGLLLGYNNSLSGQDLLFENPSAVYLNGTYVMAADDGGRIGYATSPDGIHWSQGTGWLIVPDNDTGWSGGQVREPSLLQQGSLLQLWYWGISNQTGQGAPYKSGFGFAICSILVVNNTLTSTTTQTSFKEVTATSVITATLSVTSTVQSVISTSEATSTPATALVAAALGGFAAGIIALLAITRLRKSRV